MIVNTPRVNAKPRESIHNFPPDQSKTYQEGFSPPDGESTRLQDNLSNRASAFFNFDSPSYLLKGPDFCDMDGASPDFTVRRQKGRRKNSNNSFNLKSKSPESQNSSTRSGKSFTRNSSQSEDDQPSGYQRTLNSSNTPQSGRKKSGRKLDTSDNVNRSGLKNVDDSARVKSSSSSSYGMSTVLGLLAVVAVGGGIAYKQSTSHFSPDWKSIRQEFRQDIDKIKEYFPSQTKSTMKVMKHALQSGMQNDAEHPGVIVLLYPPAARHTTHCLVNILTTTLHKAFNKSKLTKSDGTLTDMIIKSSDVPKDEIGHDFLSRDMTARLAKNRVVTLCDIHNLQAKTAHILHGILDNTGAQFKQAAVLMTLEAAEATTGCSVDETAEKILRERWSDIGQDKVDALISRVTVAVVEVEKEPTITSICPMVP